jgi:hypothetical protein
MQNFELAYLSETIYSSTLVSNKLFKQDYWALLLPFASVCMLFSCWHQHFFFTFKMLLGYKNGLENCFRSWNLGDQQNGNQVDPQRKCNKNPWNKRGPTINSMKVPATKCILAFHKNWLRRLNTETWKLKPLRTGSHVSVRVVNHRVLGLNFRVLGLNFWVLGLISRVSSLNFRVLSLIFGASGLICWVSRLSEYRVSTNEYQVLLLRSSHPTYRYPSTIQQSVTLTLFVKNGW